MRCRLCGGSVEWQGPLTDLRGTKCLSCGETNCQEVEPTPTESECNALLGCPFCGETDTEMGHNIAGGHFVRCPECGARGPIETSEDSARKKWNDWPEPQAT